MTKTPKDPIREVPITEIIPPRAASAAVLGSSNRPSDHEHRLPASMPVVASFQTGSRLLRLVGIVMVLVIIGAGTWYWWTDRTSPVHYKTALVDRGPITSVVTATGTVNPVVSVQVGSQISGKITQLMADFNSVVTKGQVLATIDPQPFQAKVNQARAALKSGRGNLAKAKNMVNLRKLELDRMTTLLRQQFVSQADLDLAATNFRDAQAQVEVAQAQVDQAVATLASAELDLGYTMISSPVTGIVVSRNVDVGQTVAASFQTPTLFVIAQNLTQMQVDTNVSESDIGGVAEGKPANFRVDAYPKQFFEGTVTQVRNAPISIQNVVTYDVVITVDNWELKLKPGMTASVTIVTDKKENPLRVPNGALRFRMPAVPVDRKATQVWVNDQEKQVRQTTVTTGIADSLFTEIDEGTLKEGDTVILGIEAPEEQAQKKLPPGFDGGTRMR